MADLEKVINGLECELKKDCSDCPYDADFNCLGCLALHRDALELLKEQEPVKPYMDYDGQDVWRCGECGNSLMHPSYYDCDNDAKNHIRYCSHCGRAIAWDEPPKEGDME